VTEFVFAIVTVDVLEIVTVAWFVALVTSSN